MAEVASELPNGASSPVVAALDSPLDAPLTPKDATGAAVAPQESSQITLPSTEVPNSPIDPNQSFKTELNDDRTVPPVIPSSLTPPPSSQVVANGKRGDGFGPSTTLFSPPATILRDGVRGAVSATGAVDEYGAPTAEQMRDASAEELRAMLQTCAAENQRLKMETAHHKLQLNLLNLQAENDLERAAVEHDMVRAQVDAIRSSEYFIQTKRELSAAADAHRARFLAMKEQYEAAVEENKMLARKIRSAKKVIMQKEEETQSLTEERAMLLNRIRENREHFQTLCSPGGILYGALTPTRQATTMTTPQRTTMSGTPRRGNEDPEHGLSALLQAMSQDNNNSAPSTPLQHRSGGVVPPRQVGRHNRNVQSLSSLPTTPVNKTHGGLLPSVSLVPQTEPAVRRHYLPTTPTPRMARKRSRESTISAEEEDEDEDEEGGQKDVYDSQATRAAGELLRRAGSVKRKHGEEREDQPRQKGSPVKKMKMGAEGRVGLGIQHGR